MMTPARDGFKATPATRGTSCRADLGAVPSIAEQTLEPGTAYRRPRAQG